MNMMALHRKLPTQQAPHRSLASPVSARAPSSVQPTARPAPPSPPSAPPTKTKFSLDGFFKKIRTKSHSFSDKDLRDANARSAASAAGSPGPATVTSSFERDVRHKLQKTATSLKSIRPPPIRTSQQTSSTMTASTNVRLCQSPGGRANVTLAIPVTPPSATAAMAKANAAHKQPDPHNHRHREPLSYDSEDELFAAATLDSPDRSSFSFGPWRDSVVLSPTSLTSVLSTSPTKISTTTTRRRETWRESSVDDFLSSFPRDLVADVRTVCCPSSLRQARQYVRYLLQLHVFEIRSTKWAAYFLQLIRLGRQTLRLTSTEAVSLRWVVCKYVRHEVETRNRAKEAQEKQFQKKMTDYRVAMQCICGTSVLKYGRKGKPHQTHLMIENGDTFRWTSKLLTGAVSAKKKHKCIPLASIIDIRAGPTTDVLIKALQKGTLRLQDAKCTLSLITAKRTFDIKTRNAAEREWLHKSFKFLVDLAHEHEKQVAQQVELSIMKRIETLSVWKHGRKGRPHKTRLFINRFGEISWQGRSNDTIQLDQITHITVGHDTAVFQRSRQCGLTTTAAMARCFSLVTPTRTLDIETESEQQRDWYVVAFRYLMDKVHEKTAALKREKAEKQLKLLQELCGGSMAHVSGAVGMGGMPLAPAPHS